MPLYEAKMIHHFDYRWATYERDGSTRLVTTEEKADSSFAALPRYWVAESLVHERLSGHPGDWLLGWRDICRSTDERTMIAAMLPVAAVNHKLPLAFTPHIRLLCAAWSSFAFDYVARQKVGGTSMTYFYLKQIPVPFPAQFRSPGFQGQIVEHLHHLITFDYSADCAQLKAQLDAIFFHLYGIDRDDVDYIMDAFPIVKRKEFSKLGEYRTKRLVLEAYDAIVLGRRNGAPSNSPAGIDDSPLETPK